MISTRIMPVAQFSIMQQAAAIPTPMLCISFRNAGHIILAADPYSVLDSSGQNFLHIAAFKGHYGIVLSCLNSVAREFRLETLNTGSISIFKAMCAADRSGLTPIHHAVQRGDYQMAKMFFEFSNIQKNPVSEWLSEPGKMKLIWLASVAGASNILRLLNAENIGIDMFLTSIPSDPDMDGLLPGMSALEHAIHTKNATASKVLLEAGASVGRLTPDPKDPYKICTLLMAAVAKGSTDIALQLIKYEISFVEHGASEQSTVAMLGILKALGLSVHEGFHDISNALISEIMSRVLGGCPPRFLPRTRGHASIHLYLDVTWVAMILHEPLVWVTDARYFHMGYDDLPNHMESVQKYQPNSPWWLCGIDPPSDYHGSAFWNERLLCLSGSRHPTQSFGGQAFVSVDIDFIVKRFGFTLLFGKALRPGTPKNRLYFMTQERLGLPTDIEILGRFREMEGVSSGFESAVICVCKTSGNFGDIHWESRDFRSACGTREC